MIVLMCLIIRIINIKRIVIIINLIMILLVKKSPKGNSKLKKINIKIYLILIMRKKGILNDKENKNN